MDEQDEALEHSLVGLSEAGRGTITVLRREHLHLILAAARQGEPEAIAVCRVVVNALTRMQEHLEARRPLLCGGCSAALDELPPPALGLLLGGKDGVAMGLCADCTKPQRLTAAVLRGFRKIWPDLVPRHIHPTAGHA